MKKDPCETCLVKACCKIQKYTVWWNCGCDLYETHRLWKCLLNYCNNNKHLTSLMINNNPRMKQLKERQQ
jgi:hypothetical protein